MATGAMEWLLLWLPVLWAGFPYDRCYGMASPMATGTMEWLPLWLPVLEISIPVLWTGCSYDYRCYGMASPMATGAMEWLLIATGAMARLL